jgi:adenosylhomocysteine nucleosidase
MRRIAIVAALPGELKPLVRGWERSARSGAVLWRRQAGPAEWVAACAGLGGPAALRALEAIEHDGRAAEVVSAGWAGALRPAFVPGRAYWVSGVVDAASGARFPASGAGEVWLVTQSRVADAAQKAVLAGRYDAGLVDMEAAALAGVCARRGVPFRAVKGVSDGPTDPLPDLTAFIADDGRFRFPAFVLHALVRPWSWPALVRMGRHSGEAAEAIARALAVVVRQEEGREREAQAPGHGGRGPSHGGP